MIILAFYGGFYAAADLEFGVDLGSAGLGGFYEIVKYAVCGVLVEYSDIAEGMKVKLVGFKLDAQGVGLVVDRNCCEIRQACFGAYAGELVCFQMDIIVLVGILVFPGFYFRQFQFSYVILQASVTHFTPKSLCTCGIISTFFSESCNKAR